MKNLKISIIILNYNGEKLLETCLNSIQQQSYKPYETIVFDNNSTDNSREIIKNNYPEVNLVETKKNLHFAKGNNEAAKGAKGEYLFFLNNDTYLDKDCLKKFAEKKVDNADIYAPEMHNYDDKNKILELGMAIDKYGFPWQKKVENIFYVEASGLLISKKCWVDLGGFDGKMTHTVEDVDLCWRARLKGYIIKTIPEAIFYHKGGATLGGSNTTHGKKKHQTSISRRYHGEKNQIRMLLKNYSFGSLVKLIPGLIFWKSAEIGFLLVTGKYKTVIHSYIKAYTWNMAIIKDTLKERKSIQSTRKISDKEIRKSIEKGNAKFHMLKQVGIPKVD